MTVSRVDRDVLISGLREFWSRRINAGQLLDRFAIPLLASEDPYVKKVCNSLCNGYIDSEGYVCEVAEPLESTEEYQVLVTDQMELPPESL